MDGRLTTAIDRHRALAIYAPDGPAFRLIAIGAITTITAIIDHTRALIDAQQDSIRQELCQSRGPALAKSVMVRQYARIRHIIQPLDDLPLAEIEIILAHHHRPGAAAPDDRSVFICSAHGIT